MYLWVRVGRLSRDLQVLLQPAGVHSHTDAPAGFTFRHSETAK